MEIYQRIRELRKNIIKTTQEEFADSIKLSRSNLGNIETNKVSVTDRVISDICDKYNVSETWLRTGEGEVFLPMDRQDQIANLTATLFKGEKDSFKERLILALAGLEESEWELLEKIAEKIAKEKD